MASFLMERVHSRPCLFTAFDIYTQPNRRVKLMLIGSELMPNGKLR